MITKYFGVSAWRWTILLFAHATVLIIGRSDQSAQALVGSNLTLTVGADGTEPFTYVWRKNGNPIGGATNRTLELTNAQTTDTGTYTALVSNSFGNATSDAAVVTVGTPALITTEPPSSQSALAGPTASVSFSAIVSGFPEPAFQWRKNGANLANGGNVSGANSATLKLTDITPADNGTYSLVVANIFGSDTSIDSVLTVTKATQAITFGPLTARIYGDPAFSPGATASSGLAVAYVSLNPAVATVSGSLVSIVGAGTTVLTATQSGNVYYLAASDVTQTLTVNPSPQTISFNPLPAKTYGDSAFSPGATASSGLAVAYASSNPMVATINGGTVSIVGAGTANLTASQPGNANYLAAPSIIQSLTVNKASQSISFAPLASRAFGDLPFTLAATATSSLPVAFSSSNPGVATVSGSTVTVVAPGTTTITASQAGNGNYFAASDVTQNLVVDQAAQTINFGSLPAKTFGDAPFALAATASSSLQVSYVSSNPAVAAVSGNTVTIVGAGSTAITANQGGDSNYLAAAGVPQTLVVNKAPQSITFGPLAARTVGDAPFSPSAMSSSTLAVSFSSSNPSVATVSGSTLTIVGAGTTTITASQAGDSNYLAAPDASQNLTVNLPSAPLFTTQPTSTTIMAGGTATFTVVAVGSPPPSIQWRKNGANITGATASTLTINNLSSTDAGTYSAVASNGNLPNAVSSDAVLTVTTPPPPPPPSASAPTIAGQPSSVTLVAGGTATFSVSATGSPLYYQWRKDGAIIAGASSASLVLGGVTTSSAGNYSVVVSNGTVSTTSAAATLTVETPPAILRQPASQTVAAGASASFSVEATGIPAPTFQWRKNGTAIPGATNATLALSAVTADAAGSYSVVVSNRHGSATSAAADLQVTQVSFAGSYFGTLPDGGSWALHVRADNTATYLAYLPGSSTAIITELTINPDGTFTVTGTTIAASAPTSDLRPLTSDFAASAAGSEVAAPKLPAKAGAPSSSSSDPLSPTVSKSQSPATRSETAIRLGGQAEGVAALEQSESVAERETTLSLRSNAATGTEKSSRNGAKWIDIGTSALSLSKGALTPSSLIPSLPPLSAAPASFTLTGRITNGQVTGSLLGQPLAGSIDSGSSTTAGVYTASALLTSSGTTYSIVGPSGKALVVTTTSTTVDGASGTLTASGQLTATTAAGAQLTVTVNTEAKTLSATYAPTGGSTLTFSGSESSVSATSSLANLSIRSTAGAADQTLIVGFSITGGSKPILVRGIGPGLAGFGVQGVLPDPKLDLQRSGTTGTLASNDNWAAAVAELFSRVGAFALTAGSRDAAISASLDTGSYTAQLTDGAGATGVALVELYDTAAGGGARLVNVSARSQVGTGGGILIAGFNVSGTGPRRLLIRAIGPALTAFGVGGALTDPKLDLFATGNATAIASNDNWEAASATAFGQVGAFNLTTGSKDAVLVVTLLPGSYTAQISGVGNTTGVALVEVYEVP